MKSCRCVLLGILILLFASVGTANAEPVSKEEAAAYTFGSNGGYVYYATLEEAFDNAGNSRIVFLQKDTAIALDELENNEIRLEGNGHSLTVDVSGVEGTEAEIRLGAPFTFDSVHIMSSDPSRRLRVHTNGHPLTLNGCVLDGSVYGQAGDSVTLYNRIIVDYIAGHAAVRADGKIQAAYIEGSSVNFHYVEMTSTAAEPGYFVYVHNTPGQGQVFSLSGDCSFGCSTAVYEMMQPLVVGGGLPIVKLDTPITMNLMGDNHTRVHGEAAAMLKPRAGEGRILFGYNSSASWAPEGVTTPADSYHLQCAVPYSVQCTVKPSIRRLYNGKDVFPVQDTSATVTWNMGDRFYRETYSGMGVYNPYSPKSKVSISGLDTSGKVISNNLEMVWTPAEGVRLTSPVVSMRPYFLVSDTAVAKREYGTHQTQYCEVYFDAVKTAAVGTLFEKHNEKQYRVAQGDNVVFTVKLADGYEIRDVKVEGCQVKQTGYCEYTLYGIYEKPKLTVIYDAHAYTHDVFMVNGQYGFVDLEETNLLSIGAIDGYHIQNVIVNGKDLGVVTRLRLTGDSKITAVFAKDGETIDIRKYLYDDTENIPGSGTASGAVSSQTKEKLIKGIQATTIKASTVNVVGTKIRVNWKKSPGYKVDYYQIFRSTKRNSGYGTKPIYTTKTGKATSYTNSKNLKVGTRYYYKVRGIRVIDGKKYYTKWSNKANRTAIYTPQASGKY